MESINECAHCGHKLLGRTDKRFCGDACRNTFNRLQRQKQRIPLPAKAAAIIVVLKRNYQLIGHKTGLEENDTLLCDLGGLTSRGFNPNFYTSSHTDNNGNRWYCVFNCCFRVLGDQVEVKDFPEIFSKLETER